MKKINFCWFVSIICYREAGLDITMNRITRYSQHSKEIEVENQCIYCLFIIIIEITLSLIVLVSVRDVGVICQRNF